MLSCIPQQITFTKNIYLFTFCASLLASVPARRVVSWRSLSHHDRRTISLNEHHNEPTRYHQTTYNLSIIFCTVPARFAECAFACLGAEIANAFPGEAHVVWICRARWISVPFFNEYVLLISYIICSKQKFHIMIVAFKIPSYMTLYTLT